ncbi:maleylpyruvate isomerase family mycothiol-dependent enzyme [Nocardioides bruguierae]|uniref:Maleylpyruvate isomerase family mycothiol-dependent enzyme n=1 Tax=Nocardioides bruguierae TaxID=2945102 RepID=A0A9X2D6K5_9ACTN|nr:maleylpyruvate isomerase family mycothiol-dependent enzyme [Nocardioides bruguierae]MCM0620323.1 maleylpyruvate isomerase family mycothiol-dependent enzyme [Nocardioides bruguierae]
MTSAHPDLQALLEVGFAATEAFLDVAASLDPDDWARPTDLPGWDVHAVVAHVAHLESVLATGEQESAEVGSPPHVRNPLGAYTEVGVVARREATPEALLAEIRSVTGLRRAAAQVDPPTDPDAPAPSPFGDLGWTWRTLLRNRPLDLWMHEQDVRRATARPGGLSGPAADHTVAYLTESLGFVLVKRAGGRPGDSVVLLLDDEPARAVLVGEDGRARPVADAPADPTLVLRTDRETYVRLAGGRCAPTDVGDAVVLTGDEGLGEWFLAGLATTP